MIDKLIKKYKIVAEDETRLDAVVDQATDAVINIWKKASGRAVSQGEINRLNKAIGDFFSDTKYAWFNREAE